jgi:hypothetical protein
MSAQLDYKPSLQTIIQRLSDRVTDEALELAGSYAGFEQLAERCGWVYVEINTKVRIMDNFPTPKALECKSKRTRKISAKPKVKNKPDNMTNVINLSDHQD